MTLPNESEKQPKMTEDAQKALNEFLAVFKNAAESGPNAFAMIAAIGASEETNKPVLAVRVFNQGSMNTMACFAACMRALEQKITMDVKI